MKRRLCRSSWRAFASTQPLMLPSIFVRKVLFDCPLSLFGTCFLSIWNPPPLSDSLPHHDLVIRTMALFLFLLEKVTLASLPTALSVALRPPFFFGRRSIFKFSTEACAICALFLVSAAPTNLPFLFPSSLTLTTLSSPPSFLLS